MQRANTVWRLNSALRYLGLLALLILAAPLQASQTAVEGVRIWNAPDHTRLVLDTTAPIQHRIFALEGPDRLVIDLTDAKLTGDLPEIASKDLVVAGLRNGIREGDDLRIVIDLKQQARVKSFVLQPNEQYGHRLVVDLEPKQGVAPSKPIPAPSIKAPTEVRDLLIAVDAGHGGEDPGAVGRAGTREKDITLAIARKLAARIDREPGMRALLIRDGDYYVGLRQRIQKARRHHADLFVSIHADAFKDRRVRGSSVFVLSNNGASSEAAKWLAAKENRADLIGGVSLAEENDALASVLLDMSQNATLEHSGLAADRVLHNLKILGPVHQPKVQKAGFAVLKSPDIPSMLVETAFISNPQEEQRLRTASFQNQVADALLEGIRAYFETHPPPNTRFALSPEERQRLGETQYRIARGDTLSAIARNHNISLASLRRANQLTNDVIRVGQVLRIPEG